MAFDDYSFTKPEDMGTYIFALFDHTGQRVTGTRPSSLPPPSGLCESILTCTPRCAHCHAGTKSELQARYSAEPEFDGVEGNVPTLFTVVLNKRGQQDTAVGNLNYFLQRVQRVLSKRVR